MADTEIVATKYGNIKIKIPNDAINSSTSEIEKVGPFVQVKCKDEDLRLTSISEMISGNGFKIKELNPPKPPKDEKNSVPSRDAPTLPVYTRGILCQTGVGNANLDLSFHCNFVTSVNIESCLFDFNKTIKMHVEKEIRDKWYLLKRQIPLLDAIERFVRTICDWINDLKKIICWIKKLITCILSTIQSIIQLITWIISLPAQALAGLMTCVTSFISNIINSISSLSELLSLVLTGIPIFCLNFTCNDTRSTLE